MEIITKSRFEKDVKKLKKRGKDFSKLEKVLRKLVNGDSLEAKYKNHALVGRDSARALSAGDHHPLEVNTDRTRDAGTQQKSSSTQASP